MTPKATILARRYRPCKGPIFHERRRLISVHPPLGHRENHGGGKGRPDHLEAILTAGIRVPDHGALKPWKLVVISGEARADSTSELFMPNSVQKTLRAKPEVEAVETGRLQRADVVIAVLSTPVEHPKIDV